MREGNRTAAWLGLAIVAIAVAGMALVPYVQSRDQSAVAWLAGQIGGSTIYSLNEFFARAVPYVLAGAIGIALFQRLRGVTREKIEGDSVVRHDKSTVASHWLVAVGMILCVISAILLVRWFGRPWPLESTYLLHFIGAALVLGTAVHHLVYHGVGGGSGLIPRGTRDLKNGLAELFGYAGVFSKQRAFFGFQLPLSLRRQAQSLVVRKWGIRPAEEDKYPSSEKVFSYAVWFALIAVLTITGTLKALRYIVPIPEDLLRFLTFLHDGSLIWVIVVFFAHVGAVTFPPINWPLLKSMFTTRIAASYVQEHLPLWYRRLTGRRPDAAAAPAGQAAEPSRVAGA